MTFSEWLEYLEDNGTIESDDKGGYIANGLRRSKPIDKATLRGLAVMLGPSELKDGCVSAIQDYADM